ncbi:malto-oligosyltrehalose synthase [Candidatus Protochlamydia phocaeensis]|uniref:malto-oligosyltrehalose synthase n=1 Tax=Candidatus Protochlamydia phocaeensis TaxID=1414722 RepID=UPI00083955F2|nr:malto-oligosyltrehalose synthase [Candidatus Protochlamydia phocaeensis]
MAGLCIPTATYRLQFNQRFTFKQALEFVPYFNELGISTLYASPITKSRAGSLHGYDVLDSNQINPEIGTEEDLQQLVDALHQRGMGLVIDIVPNHMCIADENKWWNDVLENGPSSLYANHFNIVWDPPKVELRNKVLLPVLDQQYGKVIENQELKIVYDAGAFFIDYKTHRLPVNPRTWPTILKPVIEQLKSQLGEQDAGLLELESIVTALDHLPDMTETNPEKCKERNREKEIIKKRLSILLEESPRILEAVQASMKVLNGTKGDAHSFDQLEELLDSQAYRLSFWRVTNDEINYRRFFDINELVSMRVENEDVFIDMHELILKLIKQGWVNGLRIDHVDGLFDPEQYFSRLQQHCAQVLGESEKELGRHFYVVVEKILGGDEQLHKSWFVFGTTGYDFLNLVNGIFIIPENGPKIQQIYERFTERNDEMDDVIYSAKKLILIISMSSELHFLARQLEEVSEQHRWSRDYTLESLRSALRDVIACFPVYRSYIRTQDTQVDEEDKNYVISAIEAAKRVNPAIDLSIFDFIQSVLLLQDPPGLTEEQIAYRRNFVMRFQQLTGPVTAKGVEDTAFYRYYPLASLNEVGMDFKSFGIPALTFHKKNQERKEWWPHTMLATFTHDTKRSEDVRARINVLSENPEEWNVVLHRWQALNQSQKVRLNGREVPGNNVEYLLYQTLIGSWPLYAVDASTRAQYADRIEKYMIKALKEAKLHTSWINPNEAYEKAVQEFVRKILTPDSSNRFLDDFTAYIQPIIKAGLFNSLSQTLLKMTCPGTPDFYQGSELWEFTLVDPDNRRPVDYSNRESLLHFLKEKAQQDPGALVSHLMKTPEDGLIKLYLTSQVLAYRRQNPSLFQEGGYVPLEPIGKKARHVVAFSRMKDQSQLIVAVGRFFTQLTDLLAFQPIAEVWEDTALALPSHMQGDFRDILSGLTFSIHSDAPVPLKDLFSKMPLAILEKIK